MALSTTRPNGLSSTLSSLSGRCPRSDGSPPAPGAPAARGALAWVNVTASVKVVPPPRRHHDVPAHGPRDLLDRCQPEPGAAEPGSDADIGLRERPKQPLDFVERE